MAKKRRSWEDYQKKKIKRGQSGVPIVILLVLLVIAYISGLLGGSGSLNVNRTTTAINQAFTQSPYLKK